MSLVGGRPILEHKLWFEKFWESSEKQVSSKLIFRQANEPSPLCNFTFSYWREKHQSSQVNILGASVKHRAILVAILTHSLVETHVVAL